MKQPPVDSIYKNGTYRTQWIKLELHKMTSAYPCNAVLLLKAVLAAQFRVFFCDEVRSFSSQNRFNIACNVYVLTHELHADEAIPVQVTILLLFFIILIFYFIIYKYYYFSIFTLHLSEISALYKFNRCMGNFKTNCKWQSMTTYLDFYKML